MCPEALSDPGIMPRQRDFTEHYDERTKATEREKTGDVGSVCDLVEGFSIIVPASFPSFVGNHLGMTSLQVNLLKLAGGVHSFAVASDGSRADAQLVSLPVPDRIGGSCMILSVLNRICWLFPSLVHHFTTTRAVSILFGNDYSGRQAYPRNLLVLSRESSEPPQF